MRKYSNIFKKITIMLLVCIIFNMNCFNQVYGWDRTDTDSKKGLQGADNSPVYDELGVKHTLYNINLPDIIGDEKTGEPYVYNGKTYYFKKPYLSQKMVTEFNRQGISVSVVLLMPWEETMQDMIYEPARKKGYNYYALNTFEKEPRNKIEALFDYLAYNYSNDNCHIDNWILGNEVNMPDHYNYTGTLELNTNVSVYVNSFAILYNALRNYSKASRAYISLDHSWTDNNNGSGIAGKDYLDKFHSLITRLVPGCDYGIAYHAYAPIMTDSRIWLSSRYSLKNITTPFISGDNLSVLTDYVRENYGKEHRIILSEQGFTSAYYGEEVQAAAIAYTYYRAEFNDMIDAVIFRSLYDEESEIKMGFHFGLIDGNRKRPAYDVYKYMDSVYAEQYTSQYLRLMGIKSYRELIEEYDLSRFDKSGSTTKELGTVTLGKYAAVLDPEYYLQNNPVVVKQTGYDFLSATRHFMMYGMYEGLRGNEDFDPIYYRNNNTDLNNLFKEEWWRYYEHYVTHGIIEGRKGHK